ncbi:competence protein ComK [Bacillus ectoiniformans]|uniref:competence protein ComK n=1 Tax=Bacillus ectoiniformans TaxID=1494429 RepID=UPI0019576168|nr:competence protein ComK [Bacillus ectoiniformans]
MKKSSSIYVITPQTMLVEPRPYGTKIYSWVIEEDTSFLLPVKPTILIKQSCLAYGSTYEGRRDATKLVSSLATKTPILIEGMYLFPTLSPANRECIWVSLNHIDHSVSNGMKHTDLLFKNGVRRTLALSNRSFQSQIKKTMMFQLKITEGFKTGDIGTSISDPPMKASESSSPYDLQHT